MTKAARERSADRHRRLLPAALKIGRDVKKRMREQRGRLRLHGAEVRQALTSSSADDSGCLCPCPLFSPTSDGFLWRSAADPTRRAAASRRNPSRRAPAGFAARRDERRTRLERHVGVRLNAGARLRAVRAAAGLVDGHIDRHRHLLTCGSRCSMIMMLDHDRRRRRRRRLGILHDRRRQRSDGPLAAAANQRDDDAVADTGLLQALQRCGVDRVDAPVHLDQREQHLVGRARRG